MGLVASRQIQLARKVLQKLFPIIEQLLRACVKADLLARIVEHNLAATAIRLTVALTVANSDDMSIGDMGHSGRRFYVATSGNFYML